MGGFDRILAQQSLYSSDKTGEQVNLEAATTLPVVHSFQRFASITSNNGANNTGSI